MGMTSILGALHGIQIAGAEIRKRSEEVPALVGEDKDRIWEMLRSTGVMATMIQELYRAHVREIIDRIRDGKDTRPGTAAECLAGMSEVSLEVMPSRELRAAIDLAWRLVFDKPAPGEPFLEEWAGQADETLGAIRKRLVVPERTLKKKKKKKKKAKKKAPAKRRGRKETKQ